MRTISHCTPVPITNSPTRPIEFSPDEIQLLSITHCQQNEIGIMLKNGTSIIVDRTSFEFSLIDVHLMLLLNQNMKVKNDGSLNKRAWKIISTNQIKMIKAKIPPHGLYSEITLNTGAKIKATNITQNVMWAFIAISDIVYKCNDQKNKTLLKLYPLKKKVSTELHQLLIERYISTENQFTIKNKSI